MNVPAHATRAERHVAIAAALARLDDRALAALVDSAPVRSFGIGGTTAVVDVGGTPVFVKRIALTELERRAEHVGSTANLFALPTFYQYGVGAGSAGFGAWREVAALELATDWGLTGDTTAAIPLLYHHRLIAGPPPRLPARNAESERERVVAFWDGSVAVRARLEALADAAASVVVFLEYVPHDLAGWLAAQAAMGGAALAAGCYLVERGIDELAGLRTRGLVHFDAHLGNLRTDGTRLYLVDLGLASSTSFALSADEASFLARHASYDRCLVIREWVNWLVATFAAAADRDEVLRRCAAGDVPPGVPACVATILARDAAVTLAMNELLRALFAAPASVVYPAGQLERLAG